MTKNKTKKHFSIEVKVLLTFLFIFVGVILTSWKFAVNLRQTIAASNAITQADLRALVEVEHLRNIVESQINDSRSFFLLGSTAILEQQKKEKQIFLESLASFEKQFSLAEVQALVKSINLLEKQQEEIFDQAMKFREKHTEPKIVGQFYQAKMAPIRTHINRALDEIVVLHKAELDRVHARAKEAALGAESQVPQGMTWFTSAIGFLFLGMLFLVLRLVSERNRQVAERERLYQEAQKALQARDEILVAISQDLKDPLMAIVQDALSLENTNDSSSKINDTMQSINSSVLVIEGLLKDMGDQARADQGSLTLRLDQLAIDIILDDARLMLQPIAKLRDVRLQFDSVNPPTLAFFDRERVLRVLSNLVGNAIKFSPKHSKVVIKVRSDQQFVYVSVVDSGSGIPEGKISELFDHFWQARETAEQGSGVGLAIVKTIIEAHGGTVRAESQLGHGSTFTFSLPRRRPVGAQMGRPAPIVKQAARALASENPMSPSL